MPDAIFKQTFYNAVLNTSHHAEEVEYIPAGQSVGRTITVLIVPPHADGVQDRSTQKDIQTTTVVLGKDEDHEKGGVLLPAWKDRIRRDGQDHATDLLSFSGKVLAESAHHWELEFVRKVTTQVGSAHRQP